MDDHALPRHAFSVRDFCRAYGIGRTSAYAEIAAGRLRTRKAGRRTLILLQDAQTWAASLPPGLQPISRKTPLESDVGA